MHNMTYIFHRAEGFYMLDLPSDEEAIANARCNLGTINVEDIFGYVVWEADHADK